MKAVIDTNVLVSGLLGLYTYAARIIDLVYIGQIHCVYDDRIMAEYQAVLSRPKFREVISAREQQDLLNYITRTGLQVLAAPLENFSHLAPDPDDLPFAEAAAAGGAEWIITGNHAHFSFFSANPWKIQILSPRQAYDLICGS